MEARNQAARSAAVLAVLLLIVFGAVATASFIERDFGAVAVSRVRIPVRTNDGLDAYIPGKLYVPALASEANPVPAVLALHGYQNDKDTSAAFALELARRGIAALAIDQYGHGESPLGLRHRGYDRTKGGPARFKLFMSFSALNGAGVDGLVDSSMGATAAFRWLRDRDYVRGDKVGVTGHSMGTWSAVTVARENPEHAAIVLQCGQPYGPVYGADGSVELKNYLMLQARYDEFDYFRDYELTTGRLNEAALRYGVFAGQDSPIAWNTTYGRFDDGSARRMEMIETVHRGVTHSSRAISAAMAWFTEALGVEPTIAPDDLVFMARELLVGLALLVGALSLMPLGSLLLATPFFAAVAQPMPERYVMPSRSWRRSAAISVTLSAALYPFMTQLGHGLFPYPDGLFKTLMAGGLILWLDTLAVIAFFSLRAWYRHGEGRRLGVTMYDLGLSFDREKTVIDWGIVGKTALMALAMFSYLLAVVSTCYRVFDTDLRFIWPFLRPLTPARAGQFFLYLPFFFVFFLINGGVKLFGQMRLPEASSSVRTQWLWWAKSVLVMLGGLVVVALFEYLPFFLGFGTGFALTGLSLFDGPFMSALVLIFPQFFVLFFLAVYFFRKTGRVYLGSLVVATLVTWITCGGAAYF
ncbi:MAG TPA: alpha/beta hydrolase [Spirochaetales bacterium]|nr:alpha/beta hydrolase [Spirochaetales bacterium]